MSIDRLLAFIVVGLTALMVGGIGGMLLGAATEQQALVTFLARANLSDDCKQQIEQALRGGGGDESGPAPAQ